MQLKQLKHRTKSVASILKIIKTGARV